ncbi:histidine kinase [Lentzea sp. NBRC 105346]|uniref:sensor histidine kinase n=1 Tax=Lentzea sp. NBRC 105346 TaxID=3032205 RepID=UPI0025536857|nr:histidine kinase [Lentzea sp. NBRC 105346]
MKWYWRLAALAGLGGLALFDINTGLLRFPAADRWFAPFALVIFVLPAIAWFRPHPLLAVLAALASVCGVFFNPDRETNWGLVETASLFGVLLVTTLRARSWWQAPIVVLVLFAIVVQPWETLTGERAWIFSLILLVIGVALIAVVGYLRLLESARSRQLAAVQAEQRAEFARDLHDFVGHHVTGIVVLAQGARRIVSRDPSAAAQALERIEHAGSEAMTAMRRMVGMLRIDAPIAPLAGISELSDLVTGFGPQATLSVNGPVDDLPVEVTSSVYRVVMEALTNVRRHALDASFVAVSLDSTDDWVTVRVTNDGKAPRSEGKGFGLLGLTERVQALGGRIKAGPGIDGGWVVDAAVPRTGA